LSIGERAKSANLRKFCKYSNFTTAATITLANFYSELSKLDTSLAGIRLKA
jgi:hypothetical protein